ncbi:MAG: DUF3349 domain-containing protein [Microlunatus sp.]|nr:DUF3349 domain-containing protein [Microlunatus sp.]MDN5769701.1 DUF3349 domain-containing protein [Microlunatus sp.]MDN5805255.1 DUF3349 domain-containing protein [Microlunatus sp.]
MALPVFLGSIVSWLRAGYPEGVPESDYIPLLAVLARRLSGDEVRAVTHELIVSGELPVDDTDIGTMITKVTDELPRHEDVNRVRNRLSAHGWPLTETRAS